MGQYLGFWLGRLRREVGKVDGGVVAEEHRPFDHITQFANIARPVVSHQSFQGTRSNVGDVYSHPRVILADEKPQQLRDIFFPLA